MSACCDPSCQQFCRCGSPTPIGALRCSACATPFVGSRVPAEAAFRLEVAISGERFEVTTWVLGPKGWERARCGTAGGAGEALAL